MKENISSKDEQKQTNGKESGEEKLFALGELCKPG